MVSTNRLMRQSGNMHQWGEGYPSEAVIMADMERNGGFIIEDDAGCAFDDDMCSVITEKMKESDALIVGTPVYYGQPNGGILSLMQRLFFSAGHLVQKIHADGHPAPQRDEHPQFMNFIR